MKTYGTDPGAPQSRQVGISELVIAAGDDTLKTYGLGSCLAIALSDTESDIGGLAHAMLPTGDREDAEVKPGKYADTAIRALLRGMVERGADYTAVEAKIAGGSEMFEFDGAGEEVGRRNVDAARRELERLDVALVAEDVGGDHGRTVAFTPGTGEVVVTTANGSRGVTHL